MNVASYVNRGSNARKWKAIAAFAYKEPLQFMNENRQRKVRKRPIVCHSKNETETEFL